MADAIRSIPPVGEIRRRVRRQTVETDQSASRNWRRRCRLERRDDAVLRSMSQPQFVDKEVQFYNFRFGA